MNPVTNMATNGVAGFIEDLSLVRIPPWWQSGWFIALLLVSLAVLALAGRRLYARLHLKQAERAGEPPAPAEAPHLAALRRLEELRAKMEELGVYRLAIECSWVLRTYIEARFKLRIVYQTTREFLGHAQTHSTLGEEQRGSLGEYLQFCDKVKFARHGASREEMVQLVDYAVAFVKRCSEAAGADCVAVTPQGEATPTRERELKIEN
ncbi:MAG: hypothetical protein HZA90_06210 [Verrucomicrobia bacterium]|nr:hypothetical protein [Verrucomicrobiota bacterium]